MAVITSRRFALWIALSYLSLPLWNPVRPWSVLCSVTGPGSGSNPIPYHSICPYAELNVSFSGALGRNGRACGCCFCRRLLRLRRVFNV
ncbi:hypothetical protein B0H15DRAFT_868318 [Mycena belliarum]|uniref:Secreted protein n=1 Tax=Mycena belliarum TaxID=1033014 RepID=A0AAD6TR53_9AGAR|nr:hypothetical protein B0H15DRAFT_868318 [Mycena belliae]